MLGWGEIAEAFWVCGVIRPDDVLDVLLGVIGELGFAWQVAPENAVCVLDGAALPRRVGVTEEGEQAEVSLQRPVVGGVQVSRTPGTA